MTPRALVVVQRLALLAAILASAALIIDYQNIGDPTFCGVESPCFKVRASDLGRQLAGITSQVGLSVPHVGVFAHVLLLGASLAARTPRMIRAVAALAVLGGLAAAGLLVAQITLGEVCQWCALVDVGSMTAAVASVLLARATPDDAHAAWAREGSASGAILAWSAAAAAIVGLPYLWARNPEAAPLPPSIAALQEKDKVTVISFTDFECPYCRNLAPHLEGMKKDPRVAFQRRMAPLAFHRGAEPAALAYLCVAPDQREAMASFLYEAPSGALNERGVALIAVRAGQPDVETVLTCMKSPTTRAELEADRAAFESAGGTGLPTTWVGRRVVKGFRPEQIARAFDAESGGTGFGLPIWAMFVVAGLIGGGATVMHLRAGREAADEEARAAARKQKTPSPARRSEARTSAEAPRAKRRDVVGAPSEPPSPAAPTAPTPPAEGAASPASDLERAALTRGDVQTASDSPRAKKREALPDATDVVASTSADAVASKVPGGEAGDAKTNEST